MAKKVKYVTGLNESIKSLSSIPSLFRPSNTRYIPTGLPALDHLLGGKKHPGIATGRWYEIIGQEGSGKSTLTYLLASTIINQNRKPVGVCGMDGVVKLQPPPNKVLFLDFEHATDLDYMTSAISGAVLPVLNDKGKVTNMSRANVWLHQPFTTEEGGDIMLHLMNSEEFGMVVIDSTPAMCAKEEVEKSMESNTVGIQARAMGKLFRKTLATVNRLGIIVVLVNQWRDKIGVVFGDPRHAPGGHATKYYAAARMDVMGSKKSTWFPDDGKTCIIKTLKNKITGSTGVVEYHIQTGFGISPEVEIIQAGMECGLIEYKPQKKIDKVILHVEGKQVGYQSLQHLVGALRNTTPAARQGLWALIDGFGG